MSLERVQERKLNMAKSRTILATLIRGRLSFSETMEMYCEIYKLFRRSTTNQVVNLRHRDHKASKYTVRKAGMCSGNHHGTNLDTKIPSGCRLSFAIWVLRVLLLYTYNISLHRIDNWVFTVQEILGLVLLGIISLIVVTTVLIDVSYSLSTSEGYIEVHSTPDMEIILLSPSPTYHSKIFDKCVLNAIRFVFRTLSSGNHIASERALKRSLRCNRWFDMFPGGPQQVPVDETPKK